MYDVLFSHDTLRHRQNGRTDRVTDTYDNDAVLILRITVRLYRYDKRYTVVFRLDESGNKFFEVISTVSNFTTTVDYKYNNNYYYY